METILRFASVAPRKMETLLLGSSRAWTQFLCRKWKTHLLASLRSKGKNGNSLSCLRNAGFHSAESYCRALHAGPGNKHPFEAGVTVCSVCLNVLTRVPGPPIGVTRLGSPASPRKIPVDAAACRAYRDPGDRNHSEVLSRFPSGGPGLNTPGF